jgi:hypothetical protein
VPSVVVSVTGTNIFPAQVRPSIVFREITASLPTFPLADPRRIWFLSILIVAGTVAAHAVRTIDIRMIALFMYCRRDSQQSGNVLTEIIG